MTELNALIEILKSALGEAAETIDLEALAQRIHEHYTVVTPSNDNPFKKGIRLDIEKATNIFSYIFSRNFPDVTAKKDFLQKLFGEQDYIDTLMLAVEVTSKYVDSEKRLFHRLVGFDEDYRDILVPLFHALYELGVEHDRATLRTIITP